MIIEQNFDCENCSGPFVAFLCRLLAIWGAGFLYLGYLEDDKSSLLRPNAIVCALITAFGPVSTEFFPEFVGIKETKQPIHMIGLCGCVFLLVAHLVTIYMPASPESSSPPSRNTRSAKKKRGE
jgi:hypothetical protein